MEHSTNCPPSQSFPQRFVWTNQRLRCSSVHPGPQTVVQTFEPSGQKNQIQILWFRHDQRGIEPQTAVVLLRATPLLTQTGPANLKAGLTEKLELRCNEHG